MKLNERTRKMQELWLRASQESITIPCGTKAAATNLRFQLYSAVSGVRKNPELNPELAAALGVVQVRMTNAWELVIGRSAAAEALDAVLNQLGITGEGVSGKDAIELEAERSMQALMGMVDLQAEAAAPAPETPGNPYPIRHRG